MLNFIKKTFLISVFLLPIYFVLYKIYMPKVNAFGCFDDCANFMAGYFLLNGKKLFSEIFFNHQPLMAYLSELIQYISKPINIYELVLRHRQFLLFFSFILNFLLIFRFTWRAILFILLYEFSKFYLFGDRFLAEAFIVYPVIYLFGVAWDKLNQKKISSVDYILCGIFTWMIIFSREPFLLYALFIYLVVLWKQTDLKNKAISVFCFLLLTTLLFTNFSFSEYLFNVVTVNQQTILKGEIQNNNLFNVGIIRIFFYPVFILFNGVWTFFRYYLIGLTIIFLGIITSLIKEKKQYRKIIFILFSLGLLNLRYTLPGTSFYGAFHQLVWYGLYIFTLTTMLSTLIHNKKKLLICVISIFCLFAYLIFSPNSFINENVSTHDQYVINYNTELQVGEIVRVLSEPTDTLFLDGYDDFIYWQAKRFSTYKYSWYTSFMPGFSKYREARIEMFKAGLPDFYYGKTLPSELENKYQVFYQINDPPQKTSLYVSLDKKKKISVEKFKRAKEMFYYLIEPSED